ncbi:hypothetical protein HOY36_01085 [Enterococcus sp. MMGLQ5-2]|nr:hypothetical protein [Enterococcus sp. MMGLQ5-2]MBS7583354.1 hypothetical protein [Enterococcus sp. MMGLQ5-1]NPD11214.1 hypothetical protein [Enterococcus sp. MMGLQ5-1]NPD35957.1 hypothetical protein [Enterococcus sp. MMGLQ5-2]
MEPIVTYTDKSNISRGTIPNIMQEIKNSKAIVVESRTHLGTVVLDIDYKKLRFLVHSNSLVGVMPLPLLLWQVLLLYKIKLTML